MIVKHKEKNVYAVTLESGEVIIAKDIGYYTENGKSFEVVALPKESLDKLGGADAEVVRDAVRAFIRENKTAA